MALMLSRFYGWERTCSADIHLPKNSRGMSLCLLADGSVFFYSLHRKIFYRASPDLFIFFPFAAKAHYGRFYSDLYIILPDFDL